jgi:hypothetical protein
MARTASRRHRARTDLLTHMSGSCEGGLRAALAFFLRR